MDRWTRFTRNQEKDLPDAVEALDGGVVDEVAFKVATERALAHGEERAIILIELDADDAVTAAAEARITRTIRPDDLLGRLDGGRLAVLTGLHSASRVAIRLADRLREPFNVGHEQVRLTPQVGVGHPSADIGTAEAILREAENSPPY